MLILCDAMHGLGHVTPDHTHHPEKVVVVDEELHDVGGLGCHGNVVERLLGRQVSEEIGSHHHGDVSEGHLVLR